VHRHHAVSFHSRAPLFESELYSCWVGKTARTIDPREHGGWLEMCERSGA
jgi:hypothetical protein